MCNWSLLGHFLLQKKTELFPVCNWDRGWGTIAWHISFSQCFSYYYLIVMASLITLPGQIID